MEPKSTPEFELNPSKETLFTIFKSNYRDERK